MSERDQTMPDLFAWQESPDYVDDEPQEWWIAGWEKGFERGQEALRSRLALQEAESVRLLQYARRAQSLIETVDRVAERQGDDQFVYFYNLPSGPWHGLLACARDFPEASHRTALLAAVIEAADVMRDAIGAADHYVKALNLRDAVDALRALDGSGAT